ncbi:hypothetical protein [Spiroplasma poulsonii]|uniref:hypothetical protein n=1 Tax=Spiroplasma poulsonii TaxID=2138 RepID=UPI001F4CB8BF|nr:hypothetical protein [Spiroplasma poulsonii]UNF62361.1 hypothetical protein MNU24_02540 [Spiroplasma poulsonii]
MKLANVMLPELKSNAKRQNSLILIKRKNTRSKHKINYQTRIKLNCNKFFRSRKEKHGLYFI